MISTEQDTNSSNDLPYNLVKVILNCRHIKKDYKKSTDCKKKPYHYLFLNIFIIL